jgi:hypothetical protein
VMNRADFWFREMDRASMSEGMTEARAAVAELIDALKQCISCEFACTDKEAVARAEAAIAACKGGEV